MGNAQDKAYTTKTNYTGSLSDKNGFTFALSAMQGWRPTMEDAHTIIENLATEYSKDSCERQEGHIEQNLYRYNGKLASHLKKLVLFCSF